MNNVLLNPAELKPCPFCNGIAEFKMKENPFGDSHYVECTNQDCHCHTGYCNVPIQAQDIWNRRYTPTDTDEPTTDPLDEIRQDIHHMWAVIGMIRGTLNV